jgi:ribose transport system ATP-binding protein
MGALTLDGVSKRYPGQVALDDVDLEIRKGEVHALVGQNGSGKSTLIKILAGYHAPEPGARASLAGASIELGSGRPDGVRVIHQDLGLVDDMTVAENVMLEASSSGRRLVSDRHDERVVGELLARFDLDIDPRRLARSLGAAARTMVAIVRALRDGIDSCALLILDEPTAALPEHETEQLFALVRGLREQGASVLFVSHRLPEVFALADRVTVLRDGKRVATVDVGSIDETGLVELIVGRSLSSLYPDLPEVGDDVVLTVESLAAGTLRDLSFTLRRGEVMGVAGLTGSGREVVAAALGGAVPWEAGRMVLDGTSYARLDPRKAIAAGLAYVPADRRHRSATPPLTIRENVTLPSLRTRRGWLGVRSERRDVAGWLDRVDVRPRNTEAVFATLSGGNQQRAVLARWFRHGSRVFAIDEPTQGVDVAGKADIYQQLAKAAQEGAAVIIASTDVEELASVCDRVLVLRNGRVAAELRGDALDPHSITHNTLVSR